MIQSLISTAGGVLITVAIGAAMYQQGVTWPLILRILKRRRISYFAWDRGLNATLRFLALAANEPRPSRRRVYQKLRRRLLLTYLLFIAAFVVAGGLAFRSISEPADPTPARTALPLTSSAHP